MVPENSSLRLVIQAKEIVWKNTNTCLPKNGRCHQQQMFDPHHQEQPTKSTKFKKKPALNDRPGPSSRQNPHEGHSQPFVGIEGSDNEMIITCTNTDSDNIADLINPQHVVST